MRDWRSPMKRRDGRDPPRPRTRYRDEMGVARCPKCEAPLGLKYTRRGPAYVCRCPARRAA